MEESEKWLSLFRSKKPKIKSVNDLKRKFESYVKFKDEHKEFEIDYKGQDAREVKRYKRPLWTKANFARYCGYSRWEDLKNLGDKSQEMAEVIKRIEGLIFDHKLEGAAWGFYSHTIIAHELGYKDQEESKNDLILNVKMGGK